MKETNWREGGLARIWQYYTPPARPSPSELGLIGRQIEKKRAEGGCEVLILGVTEEYRLLCRGLGIVPTLVDFNAANYDILSEKIGKRDEKFVLSDWREMQFREEFDVVLGDNALNVIMGKDHEKLLGRIRDSLKKGGLFLPRLYTRKPGEKVSEEEVLGVLRRIRNQPERVIMDASGAFMMAYYDFGKDAVFYRDIWDALAKAAEKDDAVAALLGEIEKLGYKNSEFCLYLPEEGRFEETVGRFFSKEGVMHGSEDYLDRSRPVPARIYVLRKQ
jgi:SAM-dependent methyltransferase